MAKPGQFQRLENIEMEEQCIYYFNLIFYIVIGTK